MAVFFVFSDESGKYRRERDEKFIAKNPFYCRSAVFLEAHDWMRLRDKFYRLKKEFLNIDLSQKVKWSYVWSLFKHRQKGEKIGKDLPYFFLRHHSLDKLIEFVRRTLCLLHECESSRILLTLTFNDRERTKPMETKEILKMHLGHTLEMAEKEMKKRGSSLSVFFFNPEETLLERHFQEAFRQILGKKAFTSGSHVKESLTFEYFPQSFGSQIADYCAGVFYGSLRFFPQSVGLFQGEIWPKIVKEKGEALGSGITEIPKNQKNRRYLEEVLKKILEAKLDPGLMSLEARLKAKV